MGVGVGVAQLVGNGIQHQVAGLAVDFVGLHARERVCVCKLTACANVTSRTKKDIACLGYPCTNFRTAL